MKRIFVLLFLSITLGSFSQSDYQKLKDQLEKSYPELDLNGKILFVNYWSGGDIESKGRNEELNKTIKTFQFAKLKGGLKGIVGISICIDSIGSENVVKNSGYSNLKTLSSPVVPGTRNVVYDSSGNMINQSIEKGEIFESIHQLITR